MSYGEKIEFNYNVADTKNSIKSWGIASVVFVSLISSAFIGITNSNAMLAVLFCLTIMFYCANRSIVDNGKRGSVVSLSALTQFDRKLKNCHLWLLALAVTAFGLIRGPWGMGNLIDLVIVGCGVILIVDAPDTLECYEIAMKLIRFFAVFYAVSIWIHKLLPGVYEIFLNSLTTGSDERIKGLSNYYTGFATSPVHTAGYIAAGIFAFLHDMLNKKRGALLCVVFLFASLSFTGLRMQMLAVCLCIVVFLFVFTKPADRRRLIVVLGVLAVVALVALVLFREQLERIPIFGRIYMSIERVLNGEDVGGSRGGLYALAVKLFKQKPVLGIGWGNFRLEVPGNVTQRVKYDVHNIYLQLLCEVGIVGFVGFCIPMFYTFGMTVKEYLHCVKREKGSLKLQLLGFGFLYQIFFLVVGLTDNTLYNPYSQIPYFLCGAILFTHLKLKQSPPEETNLK